MKILWLESYINGQENNQSLLAPLEAAGHVVDYHDMESPEQLREGLELIRKGDFDAVVLHGTYFNSINFPHAALSAKEFSQAIAESARPALIYDFPWPIVQDTLAKNFGPPFAANCVLRNPTEPLQLQAHYPAVVLLPNKTPPAYLPRIIEAVRERFQDPVKII